MRRTRLSSMAAILGVIGLATLLCVSNVVACELGPNQQDFRWELAEDAFPQPNGLLVIAYEDPESHRTTHVTYHRVLQILPKPEFTKVAGAASQTLVEVDGTLGQLIYVIVSAPLLYGTDLDAVGLPRRVWLDADEDGLNGNEVVMTHTGF